MPVTAPGAASAAAPVSPVYRVMVTTVTNR